MISGDSSKNFPSLWNGWQVKHIDTDSLQWKAEIADSDEEWEAEFAGQMPDRRSAWSGQPCATTEGVVTFHPVTDVMSKVLLQLACTPEDSVEKMGDGLGAMSICMQEELERLRAFVLESDGQEAGTPIDNLPNQAFL